MKLSVSAYRAHASAHKKILDTAAYNLNLNYGSVSASHLNNSQQYKVSQQGARGISEKKKLFDK